MPRRDLRRPSLADDLWCVARATEPTRLPRGHIDHQASSLQRPYTVRLYERNTGEGRWDVAQVSYVLDRYFKTIRIIYIYPLFPALTIFYDPLYYQTHAAG